MHEGIHVIVPLQIGKFDISITTPVFWSLLASFVLCVVLFIAVHKLTLIPKNHFQNLLEICIEFIEKQILIPADLTNPRWAPFILTIFLFILFNDWVGILPGAIPTTSNINSTGSLAILVFIIATFMRFFTKGITGYFKSLVPKGIKGFMIIFILPLEFISQLVKPFSLALRLFANMSAGHLLLLTFIGFTVLFQNIFVNTLSVAGTVVMSLFELFIGLVQAYIFAFLSALFIGESLADEH
ncbi:MAG: F0F1 ATP synthase subunit A [Candidatus Margulisbacteria bacterium]|nr:F0F1 ATP synthase subunit A [Candidatus Margulisiibacteriota bacterium]